VVLAQGRRKSKQVAKATSKLHPALAKITSFAGVKFKDSPRALGTNLPREMSSFSEAKLAKTMDRDGAAYVEYTRRFFARVYPAGTRVDSSNYDPVPAWTAGCQLVALNYQTPDVRKRVNDGKFRENGDCGYLLKPAYMRDARVRFDPRDGALAAADGVPGAAEARAAIVSGLRSCRVKIAVVSAQQLPKPHGHTKGEVIDPCVKRGRCCYQYCSLLLRPPRLRSLASLSLRYCKVEVHGLASDNAKHKTGVVDDNGFNPVWNESFDLDVKAPELALLHLAVHDHDDVGEDALIASVAIPVHALRTGFRRVQLYSREGAKDGDFQFTSLWVHVEVERGPRRFAPKRGGNRRQNSA